MAPRIRNISADEFRRLFKAPEIQSPGLTVSDALALTNALEQRRQNELTQRQQMAQIEKRIAEEEEKTRQIDALALQQRTEAAPALFEQAQADIDPTSPGIEQGPLTADTVAQIEANLDAREAEVRLDPTGFLKSQRAADLATQEAQAKADLSAQEAQQRLDLERAKSKDGGLRLTPGQKQLDKEFAKSVNEFQTEGGAVGIASKIGKLKNAQSSLSTLMERPEASQLTQRSLSALPEAIRSFVAPELQKIEQDSRSAVTELLRATLGAQFTEREGERIFSQTFNPSAPMIINLQRLQLLTQTLEETANAKTAAIDHFNRNGTIKGFEFNIGGAQQRVLNLADSFKETTTQTAKPKSEFKIIGRRKKAE